MSALTRSSQGKIVVKPTNATNIFILLTTVVDSVYRYEQAGNQGSGKEFIGSILGNAVEALKADVQDQSSNGPLIKNLQKALRLFVTAAEQRQNLTYAQLIQQANLRQPANNIMNASNSDEYLTLKLSVRDVALQGGIELSEGAGPSAELSSLMDERKEDEVMAESELVKAARMVSQSQMRGVGISNVAMKKVGGVPDYVTKKIMTQSHSQQQRNQENQIGSSEDKAFKTAIAAEIDDILSANKGMLTIKQYKLVSKEVWAKNRWQQIEDLNKNGELPADIVMWGDFMDNAMILKTMKRLQSIAQIEDAKRFQQFNYQTFKYNKKAGHASQFALLNQTTPILEKLRLFGKQFTDKADKTKLSILPLLTNTRVLSESILKAGTNFLSDSKLKALDQVNEFAARFLWRQFKYDAERNHSKEITFDSMNEAKLKETDFYVGAHTLAGLIASTPSAFSKLNHWKARGYNPQYVQFDYSFKNVFFDTLYVMIIPPPETVGIDYSDLRVTALTRGAIHYVPKAMQKMETIILCMGSESYSEQEVIPNVECYLQLASLFVLDNSKTVKVDYDPNTRKVIPAPSHISKENKIVVANVELTGHGELVLQQNYQIMAPFDNFAIKKYENRVIAPGEPIDYAVTLIKEISTAFGNFARLKKLAEVILYLYQNEPKYVRNIPEQRKLADAASQASLPSLQILGENNVRLLLEMLPGLTANDVERMMGYLLPAKSAFNMEKGTLNSRGMKRGTWSR